MYGYIYKTTCLKNGKIYIGKRSSSAFVPDYYGSGKLIKRAVKKYGENQFKVEMVDKAENLNELNEKEKYYIREYKSQNKDIGYNIAGGGDGGFLLKNRNSKEYKDFVRKCKLNSIGKNNPNYGKGDKIRGDKNPAKRPEVRKKISKAVSGKGNGMYGKKHTKKTREIIAKNHVKKHGFFRNGSTSKKENWRVIVFENGDSYVFRSKTSFWRDSRGLFKTSNITMENVFDYTDEVPFLNLNDSLKFSTKFSRKAQKEFIEKNPNTMVYNYKYLEKENPELICVAKETQIM